MLRALDTLLQHLLAEKILETFTGSSDSSSNSPLRLSKDQVEQSGLLQHMPAVLSRAAAAVAAITTPEEAAFTAHAQQADSAAALQRAASAVTPLLQLSRWLLSAWDRLLCLWPTGGPALRQMAPSAPAAVALVHAVLQMLSTGPPAGTLSQFMDPSSYTQPAYMAYIAELPQQQEAASALMHNLCVGLNRFDNHEQLLSEAPALKQLLLSPHFLPSATSQVLAMALARGAAARSGSHSSGSRSSGSSSSVACAGVCPLGCALQVGTRAGCTVAVVSI